MIQDTDIVVRLISSNAGDEMVAQAARVSTKGINEVEDPDSIKGLINYLVKHRHGSPFEHNFFQFYVKAPIFVFREFHRHRIGFSYNEMSGRYMELLPEFYFPPRHRPLVQAGSSAHPELVQGEDYLYEQLRVTLQESYDEAWRAYQYILSLGVAREVARAVLPVGIMSQMYVSCNARSLMHFLSLRVDHPQAAYPSKPQWEIQQVAQHMEIDFASAMPLTWQAFNNNGRVTP